MNRFTKFIYAFLMIAVFTIATAFSQCPPSTWNLNVTINPDQYPEETSWYIMNFYGDTLMQGGTYENIIDYEPQYASACAPIDSFYFVINDAYGDGIAGSLWGGNDGSVYIEQCGDTIWELPMADFGYQIWDVIYTSGCPPPPPIFGCMDSSYVEFDLTATLDTGMCYTPKVYGCTDSLAYNYLDSANTDINIDSCMHELELSDLAGNGWAGSSLKVSQATSMIPPFNYQELGTYTLLDGFDTTFFINLAAGYPVRAVFEITNQSDFTAVQCGYKLYSEDYVAIDIEGGFVNPIPPFFPIIGQPYCGNNCIEKTYGCTDSTALNYIDTVNTDDGSCYYVLGCMNPIYLEYNPDADFDDISCLTEIVYGCMDSTALNYEPLANVEIENSCIALVEGCTDETMFNYNVNANFDNNSCIPYVYGCIDETAFNYDSLANTNDGSCIPVVWGCIDGTAFNFNPSANSDDGSCIDVVFGCTDPTMFNYDLNANTDNGNCIPVVFGCTDSTSFNFNPTANTDNNSCVAIVEGCTNPIALNYCDTCNTDDFTCVLPIYGCTDSTMFNYNPLANVDNGSCLEMVYGCTDPNALNYNVLANVEDFSCIDYIYGCTDPMMFNYNPNANTENGSCIPFVYGCTDEDALNYDILANTDDNSCIEVVLGCTDATAINYEPVANVDDGSCIEVIYGCIDASAFNYNPLANTDDGSCIPVIFGCIDPTMFNYCDTCNTDNGSCIEYYYGCTDSTALNYDDNANTDNGSCIYPLFGCTDPSAINYNSNANLADSSCYYSANCYVGDIYYIPNECFEWVIDIDSYCCDVEWDETCGNLYQYCLDGWTGTTDVQNLRESTFNTYPNPTNSIVYFSNFVDVKVYDVIGSLIKEEIGVNNITLEQNGLHLLVIKYNELSIVTKVIKN